MAAASPLDDLATAARELGVEPRRASRVTAPAGVGIRLAAGAVDLIAVLVAAYIAVIGLMVITNDDFDGPPLAEARGDCIVTLAFCAVALTYSASGVLFGCTPAKFVFRLAVVSSLSSAPGGRRRLALRWLLQFLPVFVLASTALVRLWSLREQTYQTFVRPGWDSADLFASGYTLAILVTFVLAALSVGTPRRPWYDHVAGTLVVRSTGPSPRGPRGFEPILTPQSCDQNG